MDRSRFLAGLIGPVLIVVAVSVFINDAMMAQMTAQMSNDYGLIFVAGVITMIAGLAVVLSHNIWKGWPAVITALGWLAVVGGALRILAPRQMADFAPAVVAQGWPVMLIGGLVILLGLFLTLKAFRA